MNLAGRFILYVVAGAILAIAAPFIGAVVLTAFLVPAVLLFIHPILMLESYGAPGALGAVGFMPVAALCRDLGLLPRDRFAVACGVMGALIASGWIAWNIAREPVWPPRHEHASTYILLNVFTVGVFGLSGGISGWVCGKLHPRLCAYLLRWLTRSPQPANPS